MPRRSSFGGLPTPAAILDLDVLERNVAAMAAKARALGVALRPHAKTHKCVEVARLQREHGASGLTVATLAEARAFAEAGFDDVTWAVPVLPGRLGEVIELARRITFRVLVASEVAAAAVEAAAREAGVRLHVWLEVDSGQHRTGVDPASDLAERLAARLAGSAGATGAAPADTPAGLVFDGILTHAGQGYTAPGRAELLEAAATERDVMVALAERLRRAGIAVPGVSIGSTPTMAVVTDLAGVTEIRPGNYVFNDFVQAANGVCRPEDCALSVLATVISHQPGAAHAVVDAGALGLSKDLGPSEAARRRGYGPLLRWGGAVRDTGAVGAEATALASAMPAGGSVSATLDPTLQVVSVTQEHGVVAGASPADVEGRLTFGEQVRILANHSCLTAALYDEYVVVRGDSVVGRWAVHRRR